MKKCLLNAVCVALLLAITNGQAGEKKGKVTKVNCVVAGKEISLKDAVKVSYRKATAYVCCNNCKAKFEESSAKYATKANHQLFLTSQAKQTKCPISGGKLDKTKTAKISGTTVAFCCGNCQAKAEKATGDEQLAIAFSDKAFDKGFEVKKKKK